MWRYKSRMAPWRKIDVIRLCKCKEFKHYEIDMSWIHIANIWCLITATYFLYSMVAVSLERTFWEMCDDMVPVRFGRTKCDFVFFITVQSCDIYMIVRLSYCHFAHYTTSLSSLCRRFWKYWASKILVMYILSSMCLKSSQFSQSVMQYMGLCVFSLPLSLVMIVKERVLYLIIIIKSQVWTICHCLGLGHETMICTVCLSLWDYHVMNTVNCDLYVKHSYFLKEDKPEEY